LPKDLPKEIVIDVSTIDDVNAAIFVRDLDLASGVEIKDDLDQIVVTVMEIKEVAEEEVEEAEVNAAGSAGEDTSEASEESEETKSE